MWYHIYVGPLYPRALPVQTGGALFAFGGASVLAVGRQVKVIQRKIPKIQGGFTQKAFSLAHQLHRAVAAGQGAAHRPQIRANAAGQLQPGTGQKAHGLAPAVCQPKSRAGGFCVPIRWNFERAIEFLHKPESFACRGLHCRPATVRG